MRTVRPVSTLVHWCLYSKWTSNVRSLQLCQHSPTLSGATMSETPAFDVIRGRLAFQARCKAKSSSHRYRSALSAGALSLREREITMLKECEFKAISQTACPCHCCLIPLQRSAILIRSPPATYSHRSDAHYTE